MNYFYNTNICILLIIRQHFDLLLLQLSAHNLPLKYFCLYFSSCSVSSTTIAAKVRWIFDGDLKLSLPISFSFSLSKHFESLMDDSSQCVSSARGEKSLELKPLRQIKCLNQDPPHYIIICHAFNPFHGIIFVWSPSINVYQSTHMFFENSGLLIKEYINYVTQITLVLNYTNHGVLKFSLSLKNK